MTHVLATLCVVGAVQPPRLRTGLSPSLAEGKSPTPEPQDEKRIPSLLSAIESMTTTIELPEDFAAWPSLKNISRNFKHWSYLQEWTVSQLDKHPEWKVNATWSAVANAVALVKHPLKAFGGKFARGYQPVKRKFEMVMNEALATELKSSLVKPSLVELDAGLTSARALGEVAADRYGSNHFDDHGRKEAARLVEFIMESIPATRRNNKSSFTKRLFAAHQAVLTLARLRFSPVSLVKDRTKPMTQLDRLTASYTHFWLAVSAGLDGEQKADLLLQPKQDVYDAFKEKMHAVFAVFVDSMLERLGGREQPTSSLTLLDQPWNTLEFDLTLLPSRDTVGGARSALENEIEGWEERFSRAVLFEQFGPTHTQLAFEASVSERIEATYSTLESWTVAANHPEECNSDDFCLHQLVERPNLLSRVEKLLIQQMLSMEDASTVEALHKIAPLTGLFEMVYPVGVAALLMDANFTAKQTPVVQSLLQSWVDEIVAVFDRKLVQELAEVFEVPGIVHDEMLESATELAQAVSEATYDDMVHCDSPTAGMNKVFVGGLRMAEKLTGALVGACPTRTPRHDSRPRVAALRAVALLASERMLISPRSSYSEHTRADKLARVEQISTMYGQFWNILARGLTCEPKAEFKSQMKRTFSLFASELVDAVDVARQQTRLVPSSPFALSPLHEQVLERCTEAMKAFYRRQSLTMLMNPTGNAARVAREIGAAATTKSVSDVEKVLVADTRFFAEAKTALYLEDQTPRFVAGVLAGQDLLLGHNSGSSDKQVVAEVVSKINSDDFLEVLSETRHWVRDFGEALRYMGSWRA